MHSNRTPDRPQDSRRTIPINRDKSPEKKPSKSESGNAKKKSTSPDKDNNQDDK